MQTRNGYAVKLTAKMKENHRYTIDLLGEIISKWSDISDGQYVPSTSEAPEDKFYAFNRNKVFSRGAGLCKNSELTTSCSYLTAIIMNWCKENNPKAVSAFDRYRIVPAYWIEDDDEYNYNMNLFLSMKRLHAAIYIRNALIDLLNVAEVVDDEPLSLRY